MNQIPLFLRHKVWVRSCPSCRPSTRAPAVKSNDSTDATRLSATLALKVNLPDAVNFRALCDEHLVLYPADLPTFDERTCHTVEHTGFGTPGIGAPQHCNPKHQTSNTKRQTPYTKPQTQNPKPQTPNPKPQNLKPKHQTPNTKHQTRAYRHTLLPSLCCPATQIFTVV